MQNSVRKTSPKLPWPMTAFALEAYCIKTAECPTLQKSPHTFLLKALATGMVQTSQKPFHQNQIKKKEGNPPSGNTENTKLFCICLTRPACLKSSWTGLYERRAMP